MPQTILAILALMLATTLAHQQQRQVLRSRAEMLRNEFAMHASVVAEDRLGQIGITKFDEEIPTGEDEKLTSPSELTAPDSFGVGYDTQANDLDDFDGVKTLMYRTTQYVDQDGNISEDSLAFRVETEVSYVKENDLDEPVSYETKAKRVQVIAYSVNVDRPDTTRISWPFTCGTKCDW